MEIRSLIILLSIISYPLSSYSISNTSKRLRLFNNLYLGENVTEDVAPVFSLSQTLARQYRLHKSDDNAFYQGFTSKLINTEVEDLYHFWQKDLLQNKGCPAEIFTKHYDYISYLYRLITISYIHEVLIDLNKASFEFGLDHNSCSLRWQDGFDNCMPKSRDMKKFLKRISGRHLDHVDFSSFKRLKKDKLDEVISSGLRKSNEISLTRPLDLFLQRECSTRDCVNKNIENIVKKVCAKNKKLLNKLCSENDQLYGLSNVKEATILLERSNAINVINSDGDAHDCLKKFIFVNKFREESSGDLNIIFPIVMNNIHRRNEPYLQGSLFTPGALREFDDLGVGDLLFESIKKDKIVIVPTVENFVAKAPPKIKKSIPKRVVKKFKKVKKKVVKKQKKISQFQLSVNEVVIRKLKRSAVNMALMKDDFRFPDKLLLALRKPLEIYQTRDALGDMKKFDQLGTREEPVRLLFLKYLIDHDFHQGLFNIIDVIGKNFYVVNDIEKKKASRYVELENSEYTNFKWQLYVLRDPES